MFKCHINCGIVLLTLVPLLGCGGKPQVKYQPGDRNVQPGEKTEWNFDNAAVGTLPAGLEVFSGNWTVRAEDDAPSKPNVLCQTATAEFPTVCLSDKIYTDVVVTTRFKPISGKDDQAAGIIFRVQDKDNYYILRANALEDNVIFFRYASGSRSSLKEAAIKVPVNQWSELRVEVQDNYFRGFLNDQLVIEVSDDAYAAGKIGLWTKADSVTRFDNVIVIAK
jgi:3-keto-disaccharide hydrolase